MEKAIQFRAFCDTDPGCKRQTNEDVCHADSTRNYYLVADGIGGSAAGEIASATFCQTVQECFSAVEVSTTLDMSHHIESCFFRAHQRIRDYCDQNPDKKGMGCTAELLAFHEEQAYIGHVGDSRTYLFREGRLQQLTEDHSFVHEQIKAGLVKKEDARKHQLRNLILRAVGIDESLKADIFALPVCTGDIFLLCTDGLTDMLEDEVIQATLQEDFSLTDRGHRLIYLAKQAGGKDNIGVVLVEAS